MLVDITGEKYYLKLVISYEAALLNLYSVFSRRARSAGNGSSMEAPGVKFTDRGNDIGLLEWVHLDGAHKSNTNDGKRSEWVNFLRTGDQVQLIPTSVEDSLVEFIRYSDDREEKCRVFGITTVDRPLGSDPVVLCSFRCDS